MFETYYTTEFEDDETNHWWYRARRRILKSVIGGIALPAGARILDIGVGPAANLYAIYPQGTILCGVEPTLELVKVARQRGSIPVYVGTAEELPPPVNSEHFDAIAMLDVLEHTEDDVQVLRGLRERLVDGGVLILTIPAYRLLWTAHDVAVGHYRRYRLRPLVRLLRQEGYGIERATYFNTLLLVPILALRLLRRMSGAGANDEEAISDTRIGSRRLGRLLYGIFAMERHLLRCLNFPAGVSLLVIARKR